MTDVIHLLASDLLALINIYISGSRAVAMVTACSAPSLLLLLLLLARGCPALETSSGEGVWGGGMKEGMGGACKCHVLVQVR